MSTSSVLKLNTLLQRVDKADLEIIDADQSYCRFVNREISWLQFNSRVLSLASDSSTPLLERVRFLGIFNSNLDEFFMKRVGGLERQVDAGVETLSPDGLTPKQQLSTIHKALAPQLVEQDRLFNEELHPTLIKEGIKLLEWEELSKDEKNFSTEYFKNYVFPLLTPLSVDSGHPFPFISNLSTSIGFALQYPDSSEPLFCRVKIENQLPYWIKMPDQSEFLSHRFLNIQSLIVQHADLLFPGMKVRSWMAFRITRNIDLEVDDEDAEDLMELIERELRERRSGKVVRLEYQESEDKWILDFLSEELSLKEEQIYKREGLLDYSSLSPLQDLNLSKLKFAHWSPVEPQDFAEDSNIFSVVRNRDVLVHHPYESFSASVERFLREAANDAKVRAIKMTIYRVGQVTPLIPYLIQAAYEGKQVVCLVELKARFDERHNIKWAKELEKAGVHVVYGIPGLKTHAKSILVIRQDNDALRTYAHCGTGNYHTRTSSVYTDFGIFTSKSSITRELADFFNYLSGRSLKKEYQHLLVAPVTMERRFLEMIEREIENHKKGLPTAILAKMNALEDRHIIEILYRASQEGVPVDLIVRGACCLRPGVPGLSDNIRVVSIVGRLLEHSRIYYFRNGAQDLVDGDLYIGSADWMSRNLHRRVELGVPIEDRNLRTRIWNIINIMLSDRRSLWEMQSDGFYVKRHMSSDLNQLSCHDKLQNLAVSFSLRN